MTHKLHLISRADNSPGGLVLEVAGCLTQGSYLILLKRLHQLKRRVAEGTVTVDVRGARHLDPDVLLSLRRRVLPGGTDPVRLQLAEPVELPICLAHVGPDSEVLAHLDGHSGSRRHAGISSRARTQVRRGTPAGMSVRKAAPDPASGRPGTAAELSPEIYDGTLDPEVTVRALSGVALELLVDALYRHLDSPEPSFGAYTWYELALDELQSRRDEAERARRALPPVAPAGERSRRKKVPAGGPGGRVPAPGRR